MDSESRSGLDGREKKIEFVQASIIRLEYLPVGCLLRALVAQSLITSEKNFKTKEKRKNNLQQ